MMEIICTPSLIIFNNANITIFLVCFQQSMSADLLKNQQCNDININRRTHNGISKTGTTDTVCICLPMSLKTKQKIFLPCKHVLLFIISQGCGQVEFTCNPLSHLWLGALLHIMTDNHFTSRQKRSKKACLVLLQHAKRTLENLRLVATV